MKDAKRGRDFDRLMIEAVTSGYSFYAWSSVAGVLEKCALKIKAYRKDYNELELELLPGEEEKLGSIISGSRILNIYVPEVSVSFSSELKTVTVDKRLKLYLPNDFTFYERRKHERVQPSKTCYVSFELNKQMVRKSVFDFSLGGIAFILPKSDKLLVAKGKLFENFTIEVDAKKLKIKAECVNTFTIDRYKNENLPYGGFKVAFRFVDVSTDDKKFLMEFIINELLAQQDQKKAN